MGETKGFLKHKRQTPAHRPIEQRIHDFSEMNLPLTPDQIRTQAGRCMDCGIPFCHGFGCPVDNCIPEINELVYQDRWQRACDLLHTTNNFPEMTGRVCPAPCETACTLAINDEPVSIRHIEFQIVERGFTEGWIKPIPAPVERLSGKRVAVIGSGPAGLAAAQQLARAGHTVTLFEKDESAGGLLRYGIPDFKLDKAVIDRRLEQLKAEGVDFQCSVNVGTDISAEYLKKMFDCVCITMGAGQPRDLQVEGRQLENVIFAMDYLTDQNKLNASEKVDASHLINAKDKTVIVIGGGDTGSDCVGTARRQGAKEIHQFEILPKPPESRPVDTPWPNWPRIMRSSTSHEEGCNRQWSVLTKKLAGENGKVESLDACKVEWAKSDDGRWQMSEVDGSGFTVKADIVILAMGFVHVAHKGLIESLDIDIDQRGNVIIDDCQTSQPWVFAAGDTVSGPSLVVRAIKGGRDAAAAIDKWLATNKG
jgi:NAD(P)H-dependent glutamate synthase small subunit